LLTIYSEITFQNNASSLQGSSSSNSTKKKVPLNLTVHKLKLMCTRLFKLDADLMKLYYKDVEDEFAQPLTEDQYDLAFYGVRDGGLILMEEIDFEFEEKKKKDQEAQEKVNLQKQTRDIEQQMQWKKL
jgi:hypothetical protein